MQQLGAVLPRIITSITLSVNRERFSKMPIRIDSNLMLHLCVGGPLTPMTAVSNWKIRLKGSPPSDGTNVHPFSPQYPVHIEAVVIVLIANFLSVIYLPTHDDKLKQTISYCYHLTEFRF